MGELLVYSASAGSGKTHSIAGEFILMLFSKPRAYRNILAVTFTNKACDEMKTRIISDLADIIQDKPSSRITEIVEHTKLSKQQVKQKASEIFKEILHDYSFFSVSTIDSFFQKILRNFTRETGIQYNYEIELDKDAVINMTVDKMLDESMTNNKLKESIIRLVEQKIDNASKWDFRKELKDFLKKVVESDYRSYETEYRDFFSDNNNLKNLQSKLKRIEIEFETNAREYTNEIKRILNKYNLEVVDFYRGERGSIVHRLLKTEAELKNKELIDLEKKFINLDNIEKWLTKGNINKEPHLSATKELMDLAGRFLLFFESDYKDYITVHIVSKNLNYAALIDYALQTLHKHLNDEGKFLISEVPVFLSEIAKLNSSSFIYEKTGTYYENFLIDEFQDTSQIQWNSFYPLILESLSSANENEINILVGDLKQSIYSWRGGDWQILASQVKEQFKAFYKQVSLDDNWRSGKTIVEFNNKFFELAVDVLTQNLENKYPPEIHEFTTQLIKNAIYENISQNTKKDFDSLIEINCFSTELAKSEDKNIDELIILRLIQQIEELQQKNYQPGDMMILVRSNKEGSYIASEIINYSQSANAKQGVIYDVISSEALFISSNKAIQLIVSCLKYLENKYDKLAFTEAAYIYYLKKNVEVNDNIEFDFEKFSSNLNLSIDVIFEQYQQKQLHDIVDIIINTLKLNEFKENVPFLNSFRDIVHEYGLKYPAETSGFLEYWEEFGIKQNLKIPDNQNAINIITIHKSKGLAADIVFVPFCSWDLSKSNNLIWASTDKEPFNVLPIWPINLDKKLEASHFNYGFYNNHFKQAIEAFNAMYVAFTRARKALFLSFTDATDNSFAKSGTIINTILENSGMLNDLKLLKRKNEEFLCDEFSSGKIPKAQIRDSKHGYFDKYPVFIPKKQIVVKSFFDKNKVDITSESMLSKGIVYHKIFENIKTITDVDKAINSLIFQGKLSADEFDKYKDETNQKLSHKFVKHWFDGTYKVINEAEIISAAGQIKRPDRIMEKDDEIIVLDYKFGQHQEQTYIKQTINYANLLSEMGYTKIKIFIWFVLSETIIEVDRISGKTEKIILN